MRKTFVIVHFQPLELYPPVMNLVDYISTYHADCRLVVLTTKSNSGVHPFISKSKRVTIYRLGKSGVAMPSIRRYLNYMWFYFSGIILLLLKRPGGILYFETLSSYPVYLYKKYFSKKTPVFIHYHEYTSPYEYTTGMKLVSVFHQKEKYLFTVADWISHTNHDRLRHFLEDEKLSPGPTTHVLPNYPSKLWSQPVQAKSSKPIKIVYAGALSMDTMYTKVFADWVQSLQGAVSWDVYSNNITAEARLFFSHLDSPHIKLWQGVDYSELANLLPLYHAGVILYNGHLPNYIFNAPNKLFEYLACGLDVWYPVVMQGCAPYTTSSSYPVVQPIDFMQLKDLDPEMLVSHEGLKYEPSGYFYENVYAELMQEIIKHLQ